MNESFKKHRSMLAAAIEKIRVYLEENPMSTRNDVLIYTGTGIPEFQAAIEAVGLVKHVSNGVRYWTAPRVTALPARINVMKVEPYVEPPSYQRNDGLKHLKSVGVRC